jgi:hypothetical protein
LKTLIEIKDMLGMGNSLIQFKSAGLLHQSAKVEIQASAIGTPELPFIMMLGWYLIVMISADSAIVGSIAASTGMDEVFQQRFVSGS